MSTSVRQPAQHVPEAVARVAQLMSSFRRKWLLCGGWAVDSWLGRQTRDHADLDIVIFEQDQRAIFEHLAGWHMVADIAGERIDPWEGRPLSLSGDDPIPPHIHATPEDGFQLELALNVRLGSDWLLRREPPVSVPLSRCARPSPWGLPTVVPEVLLFYKATAYAGTKYYMRPRDGEDFAALAPSLRPARRAWLREAIARVDVAHPWLSELSP